MAGRSWFRNIWAWVKRVVFRQQPASPALRSQRRKAHRRRKPTRKIPVRSQSVSLEETFAIELFGEEFDGIAQEQNSAANFQPAPQTISEPEYVDTSAANVLQQTTETETFATLQESEQKVPLDLEDESGDPYHQAGQSVLDGVRDEFCRLFFFSVSESEDVQLAMGKVANRPERNLQPFRSTGKLYHNRWPAGTVINQRDFACQVIWGAESLRRLPTQQKLCWIDAPRAAALSLVDRELMEFTPDQRLVVLIFHSDRIEQFAWDLERWKRPGDLPHPDQAKFYDSPSAGAALLSSLTASNLQVYAILGPRCPVAQQRPLLEQLNAQMGDALVGIEQSWQLLSALTAGCCRRWAAGGNHPIPFQGRGHQMFFPRQFAGTLVNSPETTGEIAETLQFSVQNPHPQNRLTLSLQSTERWVGNRETNLCFPEQDIHTARLTLDVCPATSAVRVQSANTTQASFFPVENDNFIQRETHSSSAPTACIQPVILLSDQPTVDFLLRTALTLFSLQARIPNVLIIQQEALGTRTWFFEEEAWQDWCGDSPEHLAYRLNALHRDQNLSELTVDSNDPAVIISQTFPSTPRQNYRANLLLVDGGFELPTDSLWSRFSGQWAWNFNRRRQLGRNCLLLSAVDMTNLPSSPVSDAIEQLVLSAPQTRQTEQLLVRWNEHTATIHEDLRLWNLLLQKTSSPLPANHTSQAQPHFSPLLLQRKSQTEEISTAAGLQPTGGAEVQSLRESEEILWLEDAPPVARQESLNRFKLAVKAVRQQHEKRSSWFGQRRNP